MDLLSVFSLLDFDKALRERLSISDVVQDGLDQVPFGWSDAVGGHYVRWYGGGLDAIALWPLPAFPASIIEREKDHPFLLELWRFANFALWDRKRVEALKKLTRFEGFKTGFVLDRSPGYEMSAEPGDSVLG